jgi:hypothetical protein
VIGRCARLTRPLLGGCIAPQFVVFHLKPQLLHLAQTAVENFSTGGEPAIGQKTAHPRLKRLLRLSLPRRDAGRPMALCAGECNGGQAALTRARVELDDAPAAKYRARGQM